MPSHLLPLLTQGRVLVTNWHVFEPQSVQTAGIGAKVSKAGVVVRIVETVSIGAKTTTARGTRYLTENAYHRHVAAGLLKIKKEIRNKDGELIKATVESVKYVESDTSLVNRVLAREVGGKQNILLMNDEAHHAYRIRREEPEEEETETFGEEAEAEEVAKVFGVPFEVIPFKSNKQPAPATMVKRRHVHAIPARAEFEILFPRIEGYTQKIQNRIAVNWANVPPLFLEPGRIPPEVEVKALSVSNQGKLSLFGPGKIDEVTLSEFRAKRRMQELVFDLARGFARHYIEQGHCEIPPHALFPQLTGIIGQYIEKKVHAQWPAHKKDLFLAPYYGWLVERLVEAIGPDTSQGEAPEVPIYESSRGPGSTSEVDFWTSRDVREVVRSHVNYVVADTKKWEQSAAYYLDKNDNVAAFVKNAGLGFAIPYLDNGQMHDYLPDFLVRVQSGVQSHLILETKGFDLLADVKRAAAERWAAAVNAEGRFGRWQYCMARKIEDVPRIITKSALLNSAKEL